MAHQTLPWASGKRRPTKRKSGKSKQFDMDRGLLAVLLSIITAVFMLLAILLESGLLLAVSGLSTLATIIAVKAAKQQAANARKRKTALPAKPSRVPASVKPKAPPKQQAAAGGAIKCTETGKPTDACPCASRHVISDEGAQRYGGPIGRPIGRKAKEPRVPTTSRAKPIEPGYAMQRDL